MTDKVALSPFTTTEIAGRCAETVAGLVRLLLLWAPGLYEVWRHCTNIDNIARIYMCCIRLVLIKI
jgi:hypothetical protein